MTNKPEGCDCVDVNKKQTKEEIRQTVRKGYTDIAKGKSGCCCGSSSPDKLAGAMGYTSEELQVLPDGANMGLTCFFGNDCETMFLPVDI